MGFGILVQIIFAFRGIYQLNIGAVFSWFSSRLTDFFGYFLIVSLSVQLGIRLLV
jgi:hypothetical protein